jgi:undecaprenyl-diphosphatase
MPRKKIKKSSGSRSSESVKSTLDKKLAIRICIACAAIFIILLVGTLENSFFLPVDNWVYAQESSIPKPVIPVVMLVITSIMSPQGAVILGIIALVTLMGQRKNRQALFLAIAMITGYLLSEAIKFLVQRLRPEIGVIPEIGFSFPSGHAIIAAVFFSLLIVFFKDDFKSLVAKRIFIAFCIFMALLIGYSRIYLGVHWLSDVLAGFALGIFAAAAAVMVLIINYKYERLI